MATLTARAHATGSGLSFHRTRDGARVSTGGHCMLNAAPYCAAEPVPDGGSPDARRGGRRQLRPAAVRVRYRGHAAGAARAHAARHRRVPAARRAGPVAAGAAQVTPHLVAAILMYQPFRWKATPLVKCLHLIKLD